MSLSFMLFFKLMTSSLKMFFKICPLYVHVRLLDKIEIDLSEYELAAVEMSDRASTTTRPHHHHLLHPHHQHHHPEHHHHHHKGRHHQVRWANVQDVLYLLFKRFKQVIEDERARISRHWVFSDFRLSVVMLDKYNRMCILMQPIYIMCPW